MLVLPFKEASLLVIAAFGCLTTTAFFVAAFRSSSDDVRIRRIHAQIKARLQSRFRRKGNNGSSGPSMAPPASSQDLDVAASSSSVIPPSGLNQGARVRLNRYCKRTGKCLLMRDVAKQGAMFKAKMTLVIPNQQNLSRVSLGRSKKEAYDNAAAQIMSSFPTSQSQNRKSNYKDREVTALVGDSVLDLVIVILGAQSKIPADVIDHVRQTVVSNKALSHGTGRALATRVESMVGKSILLRADEIIPVLKECIGQELIESIEQGIIKAKGKNI